MIGQIFPLRPPCGGAMGDRTLYPFIILRTIIKKGVTAFIIVNNGNAPGTIETLEKLLAESLDGKNENGLKQ